MADGLSRPPSHHQSGRRPAPKNGPVSPCTMASLRAKALSTHGSRKQGKFSASWTRFGRWMRDPPTAQPQPLPVSGLTRVEGQRRQCQRRALKVPGGWGWQTRRPPKACGS
ncbi:hypothetical protein GOBAR_DD30925 [Gossypium barbadense]|nr:hypothetical protein GOBAR_DD30925 [Gossypium barbadense]